MADYLDPVRAAQKRVQDLVMNQDSQIEPGLAKARDMVLSQRAKNSDGVRAAIAKISGPYGSSIPGEFARADRGLDTNLDAGQDAARFRAKRNNLNTLMNLAYDNFVKAGMGVQEAYSRARQLALTQQQQGADEALATESRDYKEMGNRLKVSADNQLAGVGKIPDPDPYQSQVMAALLGFGVNAGNALYTNKKLFPKAPAPTDGQAAGAYNGYSPRATP